DRLRREPLQRGLHHLGPRHRRRAEDHTLDAVLAQRPRVLERADAATHLDGDPHGAHHARDRRALRRAAHRRVEIDEGDPPGAVALEAARDLRGIEAVHRLLLRAPLVQAHHAALAQVDRGNDDHAALREATPATKFATSRRPTAWLFSGWNCNPSTLPRPTIAAKSWP